MHQHRFESQVHALRSIADWIAFYNQQRPYHVLKIVIPDAVSVAILMECHKYKAMDYYRKFWGRCSR